MTLRQAGARLEVRLDRCHWQAEREQAEASRLHSDAPDGRVEIVGTIISVKEQDGYMPGTSEYKALVLADAGYKVYGTASYAFTSYISADGSECYRMFSDLRALYQGGFVLMTILYTTAGPEYDGFGTQTLEVLAYRNKHSDRPYRRVEITAEAYSWQTSRYASGMYPALPQSTFDDWLEHGLIVQMEQA
jgi:hypothetical protein